MLADNVEVVIGVDTHSETHSFAVLTRGGELVDQFTLNATGTGYRQALERAVTHRGVRAWAVEGTGSYGAGLCDHLLEVGEDVFEVDHPHKRDHTEPGKSDELDAIRAARTLISRPHLAKPKRAAGRHTLGVLMTARDGAVKARADAIRQLKSLVVTSPEPLRAKLRGLDGNALILACAKLRPHPDDTTATAKTVKTIARRILALTDEANQHQRDITYWVRARKPQLLDQHGVGPITAARILLSWSHPGRLRNEACFARLAGVAPIPASSGNTTRHRLDRGGDRQLNTAIHTIALCRARTDATTKAYIERRQTEGKTRREAIRALKRHITRAIYRLLETTNHTP